MKAKSPPPDVKNEEKKDLPKLKVGQQVRVQNTITGKWDGTADFIGIWKNNHSYVIQEEGSQFKAIRNWKFLKPLRAGHDDEQNQVKRVKFYKDD